MLGISFEILAQGKGQGIIPNYQGGSSPILIFIIGAIIVSVVLALVIFVISRVWRKVCFKRLLEKEKFGKREVSLFKSYLHRLKVYDPTHILLEQHAFDSFMDSIAHLHEAAHVAFKNSIEESKLFNNMRQQLLFTSDFDAKTVLTSTRTLPKNYPLTIAWVVPATKQVQSYYGTLLVNTEFFLGVSVPEEARYLEFLQTEHKLDLDISFARKGDAQYYFFTYLSRVISQPQPMLLIPHSHNLLRAAMLSPLGIEAKLMYTAKDAEVEEVREFDVSIGTVNNQGCVFLEETLSRLNLPLHTTVIMNFVLDERDFSCRGVVSNIIEVSTGHLFQITFSQLEEEEHQFLVNFRIKQRELSLKEMSEATPAKK